MPHALLAAFLVALAPAAGSQTSWSVPVSLGGAAPESLAGLADYVFVDWDALPTGAWASLDATSYASEDVRSIAASFAAESGIPVAVVPDVPPGLSVTVEVPRAPALRALAHVAASAGLAVYQDGRGFILAPRGWRPSDEARGDPPSPADDAYLSGPATMEGEGPESGPAGTEPELVGAPLFLEPAGTDVTLVVADVASRTGFAATVAPGVSGPVSGSFGPGPAAEVLAQALAGNGFVLLPTANGFDVRYATDAPPAEGSPPSVAVGASPGAVEVSDGPAGGRLVSLDLADVPVFDAVRAVADAAGLNVVTHTEPNTYGAAAETRVSARWTGVPVDDALSSLLYGTALTAVRHGAVIVVGDRAAASMATSRLFRLRHIPADRAAARLPDAFRQSASVYVVGEQNAVLVTGPLEAVAQAERFLDEIDEYAPQILMEVLVVEFETTELKELGVSFLGGLLPPGAQLPQTEQPGWHSALFGGGADAGGGLDYLADSEGVRSNVNFWADLLGISNIGRLPADFYLRLQALDRTGRAHVRSRPHLVTLNGNPASISVGTSQYYVLKTAGTGVPGLPGGYSGYETERFERVDANVELSVTPWLTESGGITAEIRPTFTTPVGGLDPRQPPTLSTWSVESLVRLREGETIILGGLVQEREGRAENRVPLLGRIPLLGRLFRNSRRTQNTSELAIFITPHVFWGDEDEERGAWEQIERELSREAPLLTPAEERAQAPH